MSESLTKRRVVITGLGAVTPLGHSMESTWQGIREARSVTAPVQRFDGTQYASQIACEVKDFALAEGLLSDDEERVATDIMRFGVAAGLEAIAQAQLTPNTYDPYRTAVCLGVGICSPSYEWFAQVYGQGRFEGSEYDRNLGLFPDQLSSVMAQRIGAKGGITTIHTACASSGQSIGEAYEMIAYDQCDVVLTGGADSMVNPFYFAGFGLLGALSKRNQDPATASRPFDKDREGFVLGEGACLMVLESYEHAKARGAAILGEICGYGVTESAYRITDLHPEGIGPIEAMEFALKDAQLPPSAIGYVNAHGTSTAVNDRVEALAVDRVFGAHAPYVSSTKSMTGHLISAAGAVELAFCVLALRDQILPPSLNIFEQDPNCPIRLTPSSAMPLRFTHALSNSVGFGGSNTALIVGGGPHANIP